MTEDPDVDSTLHGPAQHGATQHGPAQHGAAFGLVVGQIIFEFLNEAVFRCAMIAPFVEHMADMAGQRDVAQELLGEDFLSLRRIAFDIGV